MLIGWRGSGEPRGGAGDRGGAGMAEPVLALDGVANGEAGGWRRGAGVIETLPYIDTLTAEEKANVDKVIQEEVRSGATAVSLFLILVVKLPPAHCGRALTLDVDADAAKR